MKRIKIAPSLLAADLSRVAEEVNDVERAGADLLHLDVMDGRFVPNISFGMGMVQAVRQCTQLPLDVHLMIVEPEKYVSAFARAGADIITVHPEGCLHLHRVLQLIKESGAQVGVALNPATPLAAVESVIAMLDLLLIMSVNPGFGGQHFIEGMDKKVLQARRLLDQQEARAELQVDGGVNEQTAPRLRVAGASMLVAGSYVFKDADRRTRIDRLRG